MDQIVHGKQDPISLFRLGKELLADPAANLNNVVALLKVLNAKQPQVLCKITRMVCRGELNRHRCEGVVLPALQEAAVAAIRGLKVFFLDAHEKGDLGTAAEVCAAPFLIMPVVADLPGALQCMLTVSCLGCQGQEAGEAQAVYRDWLRRQASAFHSRLLSLIAEGAPSAVQVQAA
jgi:hypothetical protein